MISSKNMVKMQIFLLFLFMNLLPLALSAPSFPCFFVFGDSLVDNGNNNKLNTLAKANYSPYGVDFSQGATGRFTNGRTTADLLAEMLGFESLIPPFDGEEGDDIINGVNYASGSAGIRSETGQQMGVRISLDRQLLNHNVTISRFARLLGGRDAAKQRLNKCLYYFVVGSNDYINNYYLPEYYSTSTLYTPDQYATVLIEKYSQQLKKLYDFGARKISVAGLGPLGCIPIMLARGTNGAPCVDSINDAVRLFNDGLKVLVEDLNSEFADARFIYLGAMDLRPTALFAPGLRFLSQPCCKVSSTGLCRPGEPPCPVRDLHFFYDDFHPTQIVNKVVATASYFEILRLIL